MALHPACSKITYALSYTFQETEELIKYLAELGKVNVKDNYGSTPLHFAAMRGNEVAAAALVAVRGVDVNVSSLCFIMT